LIDRRLLSHYALDPGAEILILTSNWPHTDEPRHEDGERHGIFLARQVQTLRDIGYRIDVAFIRGFVSSAAYARAAAFLIAASLRRRYRLVHAHGGEAGLICSLYWAGPLMISYCGDDLLGTPGPSGRVGWQSRARRALVRQGARFASATITKSQDMQSQLPSRLQACNSVIPNGVDATLFAPADRAQARLALGWARDDPIVLFAADPRVPRKRFALAQAACERVRASLPELELHVAHGAPPTLMPTLMNAADCLLMTSSVEGSPNVVKEALMCNLPVVATPAGDVRELLRDVAPSFVVGGCMDNIADAVLRCVEPARRSNGRARSGNLAGEVIAQRIAQLYERLLTGPRLACAA